VKGGGGKEGIEKRNAANQDELMKKAQEERERLKRERDEAGR
jgi:hypothetical protein